MLLLEDQGERPYRLDRMWTHLALAGVFARIRGIALGDLQRLRGAGGPLLERGRAARSRRRDRPALRGRLSVGHGDLNEPVPLGTRVRLDADARSLTFLEAAVGGPAAPAVSRGA